MYPSRLRTFEALANLSEGELCALVKTITKSPEGDAASELVMAVNDVGADRADGNNACGLRGPTGIKAELAFLAHHMRHGEPVDGALVDRRHEECGFDFEIEGDHGRVAVEVKGSAVELGGVTFTDKEWETAHALGDSYYLAFVRHVGAEPRVTIFRNPAAIFDARVRTYTIVQVGWAIGGRAIRNAEPEANGHAKDQRDPKSTSTRTGPS
jgi:hypothetical protein